MLVEPMGKGRLRIRAAAKINLFLEVLGKRPDGYHEIETVCQEVSLFDEMTLEEAPDLLLTAEGYSVPLGEENLIMKVARLLQSDSTTHLGARMHLVKRIPPASGLGGASSDAASALVGLNMLWNLQYHRSRLVDLAARVGSDVAFFFFGGTSICRGRGEIVEPIPEARQFLYLLVWPEIEVSTAQVYGHLEKDLTEPSRSVKFFIRSYSESPLGKIGSLYFNRLQSTAERLHPEMENLRQVLERSDSLGVGLSGSGSTYFLLFPTDQERRKTEEGLRQRGWKKIFRAENL